jgi:hypothetical protein
MFFLLLPLILPACAGLRATTLDEARGNCYTFQGVKDDGTGCTVDQREICDRYFTSLGEIEGLQQCLDHCDEVHRKVINNTAYQGCSTLNGFANRRCENYCYDNFD